MRKVVTFVLGFALSFGLVHVALGDSGSAVTDAGITVSDASVAVGSGAGSAAVVPLPVVVPDPTTDPGASLTLLEKLYKSGLVAPLVILLAFFLLSLAAKYVPWLKTDHVAAIVSAVLGGLALLAVPAAAGTTPTAMQLIAAVMAAVTLFVTPKKAAQA